MGAKLLLLMLKKKYYLSTFAQYKHVINIAYQSESIYKKNKNV
jgi:hypothetical protein